MNEQNSMTISVALMLVLTNVVHALRAQSPRTAHEFDAVAAALKDNPRAVNLDTILDADQMIAATQVAAAILQGGGDPLGAIGNRSPRPRPVN